MMTIGNNRRSTEAGYSALEMVVTAGIVGVIASIAVFQITQVQPSLTGDGAMRVVMGQLSQAREMAITQRRQMELQFIGIDQLQVVRQEFPAGTTVVSLVVFEGGMQYSLINGIPDTPDAFGRNTPVDFGGAIRVLFNSDGTLIDQTGSPVSGTVFVAIPSQPRSLRAITILGGTGRIRGYRWDGNKWIIA
jgi:type II secretory pathway pseudopilin PulG